MKKNMAAMTMAFAVAAFPMSVFAQEEPMTAQKLFEDAAVYMVNAEQMQATITTDNAGSVSLSSEDTPASNFSGAAKGSLNLEKMSAPLRLHIAGNATIGAMGISYKVDGEAYLTESDDGKKMDIYARMFDGTEDSGWMHEQGASEEFWDELGVSSEKEFQEMFADLVLNELPDLPQMWTVTEQDGVYEAVLQKNFAEIYTEMEAFAKTMGEEPELSEEERALLNDIMKYLVVDATAVFDQETHALQSLNVDYSGSDTKGLGEKITELAKQSAVEEAEEVLANIEGMMVGIELQNAGFQAAFVYEDVPEVTVPQEVLDATAEVEIESGAEN